MRDIEFKVDARGVAHVTTPGWATALCGAQTKLPAARGVPCQRCLDLAAERLAAEESSEDE